MCFEQSKPEPNPRELVARTKTLQLDFEKKLTQRIRAQPQVDEETWQFQGDSGEWVSFPASLNVLSMF